MGVLNGDAVIDACGVCDGDGSSCADCAGEPNGTAVIDACGVVMGTTLHAQDVMVYQIADLSLMKWVNVVEMIAAHIISSHTHYHQQDVLVTIPYAPTQGLTNHNMTGECMYGGSTVGTVFSYRSINPPTWHWH